MASAPSTGSIASQSFANFTKLPTETRLCIWNLAAIPRARIVQIRYDHQDKLWKARKGARGGLPIVATVCSEARTEALKRYTKVFGVHFDFDIDTLLISDPLFLFPKPRAAFWNSPFASKFVNVAFWGRIYGELEYLYDRWPADYLHPMELLSRITALKHFSLLMEDDKHSYVDTDADDHLEDPHYSDSEDPGGLRGLERDGENVWSRIRKIESIEPRGNISLVCAFEHCINHKLLAFYITLLSSSTKKEKDRNPEWVRPTLSIMMVERGLKQPGDFTTHIHALGDHGDDAATFSSDVCVFGEDQIDHDNPGYQRALVILSRKRQRLELHLARMGHPRGTWMHLMR